MENNKKWITQRNIAAVLIGAREERTMILTKVGKYKRAPNKQTIDHNVSTPTDRQITRKKHRKHEKAR